MKHDKTKCKHCLNQFNKKLAEALVDGLKNTQKTRSNTKKKSFLPQIRTPQKKSNTVILSKEPLSSKLSHKANSPVSPSIQSRFFHKKNF